MEERRGAIRYRLTVPVRFEKNGRAGVTRDMSISGIFFETGETRSIGDEVHLSVDLKETTIRCEGRIVRVEQLNGRFGVAVEFTSYGFD